MGFDWQVGLDAAVRGPCVCVGGVGEGWGGDLGVETGAADWLQGCFSAQTGPDLFLSLRKQPGGPGGWDTVFPTARGFIRHVKVLTCDPRSKTLIQVGSFFSLSFLLFASWSSWSFSAPTAVVGARMAVSEL